MGSFLVALVVCALAFGGLGYLADLQLAGWDPESVSGVVSTMQTVSVAGTIVVALLWSIRGLRPAAAFVFGFAAGVLATGPVFASLALEGRIPHL